MIATIFFLPRSTSSLVFHDRPFLAFSLIARNRCLGSCPLSSEFKLLLGEFDLSVRSFQRTSLAASTSEPPPPFPSRPFLLTYAYTASTPPPEFPIAMHFSGDHSSFTDGGGRSNLLPVDAPSSLPFSHLSSTTPSNFHSFSYLPSPDEGFHTQSNPYPSRSARSSFLEASLDVGIRRPSFGEDLVERGFNFRDRGGSRTGSGGDDEINKSFALDGRDGSSALLLSHSAAPSPTNLSSSSILPPPSPLLDQPSRLQRSIDWNSAQWDSLDPFAAELVLGEEDGGRITGKPVLGVYRSVEEFRTLHVSFDFDLLFLYTSVLRSLLHRRVALSWRPHQISLSSPRPRI